MYIIYSSNTRVQLYEIKTTEHSVRSVIPCVAYYIYTCSFTTNCKLKTNKKTNNMSPYAFKPTYAGNNKIIPQMVTFNAFFYFIDHEICLTALGFSKKASCHFSKN